MPSDHRAFVRLFPELGVDDPILEPERFERELVPTTIVIEDAEHVVGYAYFQILRDLTYVRHIVTAPEVRRTGVGRALMAAVAERGRAAGCSSWCLNVLESNDAARALYESVGLRKAFATKSLQLDWAKVDAVEGGDVQSARISSRLIEPEDDAEVEAALNLVNGQLAMSRALGGRTILGLFEDGACVAGTVFDPTFPGAYPFRAARPDLAFALLRATRPYARPTDSYVRVVSEGEPAIADALIAAGGRVIHDTVHMKGPLPAVTADR